MAEHRRTIRRSSGRDAATLSVVGLLVAGSTVGAIWMLARAWSAMVSMPVGRVGAGALVVAAAVAAVYGLVTLFDTVYGRWRSWQHDDIEVTNRRMRSKITVLHPDSYGRQGIAFDGEVYRDLDTLATYTQAMDKSVKPILEEMRWQHAKLQAISHAVLPQTYHVENVVGDQVLTPGAGDVGELGPGASPWRAYTLSELLQGRTPSIHDLIVGGRPGANGQIEIVSRDLHELMHVLSVGASGWGKSSWLRSFLYQVARAREPVEVVAIDVNGSEFNALRGWGKLRYPVAREKRDAIAVLGAVGEEIGRRRVMYEQHPLVTKLSEYNQATGADLPPWVVVVDEGTNLLNQGEIGDPLRDAVQTARQYGVYVLLAGQSAKHSVVDTQIRDQFSSRLCFRTSPTSSRVVLDDASAGDLHDKGRAWVQLVGTELCELQGPWVTREEFMSAMTNGGPKLTIPAGAAPVDETAARVLELHDAGESDTAIARQVYGYGNMHYIEKVRAILRQQQQTAGNNTPGGDQVDDPAVVVVEFCEFCGRSVDDAPAGVTFGACADCGVAICSDCGDGERCVDCSEVIETEGG